MSPNMQFENKFAKGDKVWAVFSIGPDVKVNELEIKAFVAEVSEHGTRYLYGFTLDGYGTNEGANMTFLSDDLIFFDKTKAEKRAGERVEDLKAEYDNRIAELNAKRNQAMAQFDDEIARLRKEQLECNANNLEVEPREVQVPPQDVPDVQADTETPETTPDKEQSNSQSDVGEKESNQNNEVQDKDDSGERQEG